jgi:hypothetical protein
MTVGSHSGPGVLDADVDVFDALPLRIDDAAGDALLAGGGRIKNEKQQDRQNRFHHKRV